MVNDFTVDLATLAHLSEIADERGISLEELILQGNIQKVVPGVTNGQRVFISENLSLTNQELAKELKISIGLIREIRDELLWKYVGSEEGAKQSVIAVAARFGVSCKKVTKMRKSLILEKPEKGYGVDLSVLGSREDIVFALTRGGQTIQGLIRTHGIPITRQGLQQALANKFGIALSDLTRTYEWYARTIAGDNENLFQRLCDMSSIKKSLKEKPLTVVAAELGVPYNRLDFYVKNFLCIDASSLKTRRIELVCSNPKCKLPDRKFSRYARSVRRDKKTKPDKLVFCSRKCFGQFHGNTVGFAAHPENRELRQKKGKKKSDNT